MNRAARRALARMPQKRKRHMDPMSPMRLVCSDVGQIDPALDLDAMGASDLDEYRKTHDPKFLKFKPNAKPTWFICEPVGAAYVTMGLDAKGTKPERSMSAFLASVRKIEIIDAAQPLEPASKDMFEAFRHRCAEWEFWDRSARKLGVDRLYEIGAAVYALSKLSEAERPSF